MLDENTTTNIRPMFCKKSPRSELKLPLATQTLPRLAYLLNNPSLVKTGSPDSNSNDEGRSGKFEQLYKPSSVLDFNEIILFKDFNSLILFKNQNNLFLHEMDSLLPDDSSGLAFLHSPLSLAKRSQVSFHAGFKPLCPVFKKKHSHTARFV